MSENTLENMNAKRTKFQHKTSSRSGQGAFYSKKFSSTDEEDGGIRLNGSTFTGFRYHADELQKSTASSATSAGILSGEEPPPYHEVVRQRKDYR